MKRSLPLAALAAFFLLLLLAGQTIQAAQKLQERDLGSSDGGKSSSSKASSGSSGPGLAPAQGEAASGQAASGQAYPEAQPGQANEWTPPSGVAPAPGQPEQAPPSERENNKTYSQKEIEREVNGFFEGGAKGLADLVAKAFQDLGRPVGFIKGGEGGGALVFGLRYGEGTLHTKDGQTRQVYWQAPSLGFDLGANASKVFTLVYGMENPDRIFQRFPGVEGSAYLVGGFGMIYQRSDGITLAPIRFGVGLRLGANIGYQHYTRYKTPLPF